MPVKENPGYGGLRVYPWVAPERCTNRLLRRLCHLKVFRYISDSLRRSAARRDTDPSQATGGLALRVRRF